MKQKTTTLLAFSAVGAYFAVLFAGGLLHGDKLSVLAPDFIIYLNPLTYAIAWLVLAAMLVAYGSISRPMVYGFTWVATVCYALFATVSGGSYYLTFAMCGLVALITVLCGWAIRTEPKSAPGRKKRAPHTWTVRQGKVAVGIVAALACGGTLVHAIVSYLSYATMPSGSTAVYVQLMESLRSGHFFDTSLEFGEIASHFGAHISPVFLLYLPFYALLPSPLTLIVLQTAAVYSAVIPLWLIARRRGLSPAVSTVLCTLLCLYPAVWSGSAGMLHEYALLLPLLLWLLWALEARRNVLVWVFAALTLCVRETAAIHLFAIGLYHLIRNRKATEDGVSRGKERQKALILAGVSLVYFAVAMVLLSTLGRGTLITRFANVTGKYGFFFDTLVREIVYNPALILHEMLTEAKLFYVMMMALPLGFLPLLSKKKAGLVFLLPFLLLNLLSDFSYHYNIDFPYSFGVSALFFYLAVEALESLRERTNEKWRLRRAITLALSMSVIVGAFCLSDDALTMDYAVEGRAEITAMDELLEAVAPDASVRASARLCPHLAARRELYTLSQEADTDVVVIDLREEWGIAAEKTYDVAYFEKLGYQVLEQRDGIGAVMVKGKTDDPIGGTE